MNQREHHLIDLLTPRIRKTPSATGHYKSTLLQHPNGAPIIRSRTGIQRTLRHDTKQLPQGSSSHSPPPVLPPDPVRNLTLPNRPENSSVPKYLTTTPNNGPHNNQRIPTNPHPMCLEMHTIRRILGSERRHPNPLGIIPVGEENRQIAIPHLP